MLQITTTAMGPFPRLIKYTYLWRTVRRLKQASKQASPPLVEFRMDDTTSTRPRTLAKANRFGLKSSKERNEDDDDNEAEECDSEAWDTLSKSFRQVQTVLDKNRELIQQANENHRSKIPDNISRNVGLIREINGNISKVISIYSDLSADFSNVVSQRKKMKNCRAESSES